MQIKKNPREAGYPETVTRYERERPTDADLYGEPASEGAYARGIAPRPASTPPRADEPRAEAPVRSESTIDRHSSFDGRFETEQDLRIEGAVSGEVICRGTLTLEKDAAARARIQAREATIKGRVEGDIVCTARLTIASTAVVTGTIRAPILVVEEGASISGNVDTTQKSAEVVTRSAARAAAEPAPAEQPARPRREAPSFALVSSDAEPAVAERR
jgi:cytoskeletal protein CcmA (bactofilin family)